MDRELWDYRRASYWDHATASRASASTKPALACAVADDESGSQGRRAARCYCCPPLTLQHLRGHQWPSLFANLLATPLSPVTIVTWHWIIRLESWRPPRILARLGFLSSPDKPRVGFCQHFADCSGHSARCWDYFCKKLFGRQKMSHAQCLDYYYWLSWSLNFTWAAFQHRKFSFVWSLVTVNINCLHGAS